MTNDVTTRVFLASALHIAHYTPCVPYVYWRRAIVSKQRINIKKRSLAKKNDSETDSHVLSSALVL